MINCRFWQGQPCQVQFYSLFAQNFLKSPLKIFKSEDAEPTLMLSIRDFISFFVFPRCKYMPYTEITLFKFRKLSNCSLYPAQNCRCVAVNHHSSISVSFLLSIYSLLDQKFWNCFSEEQKLARKRCCINSSKRISSSLCSQPFGRSNWNDCHIARNGWAKTGSRKEEENEIIKATFTIHYPLIILSNNGECNIYVSTASNVEKRLSIYTTTCYVVHCRCSFDEILFIQFYS